MELGEYVRTKYGIAKYISDKVTKVTIYKIIDKDIVYDNVDGWENVILDNEIIKSSPNIMDLIEAGDIIKYKIGGEEYISEVWGEKNDYFVQEFGLPMDLSKLNIVSIVTHEQFSQMTYRIGE